ncbi:putative ribonuclease H protein [Citrus sinensis]|uniref:Ribonuclease H protein n=1 Tax=Citrus sinensis TaxID=2711 RepID=A0ACB8MZD0_CITSI|nr:putative ribonuclease H protein [Citrus sinensis]
MDSRVGMRWNIGDGKRVRFWWDCWVTTSSSLAAYTSQPIPNTLLSKRVADFVDEIGNWNCSLFSHLLPNNILLKIASVHPPTASHGAESFFWGASSNGTFSVKSAYELLDDPIGNGDHSFWCLAWSWKGPHSIRVFLWLLLHGRLKTKKELNRRHLIDSTQCDRCGGPVEDILHTLRDCVTARRVWSHLLPNHHPHSFFLCPLSDWLQMNLMRKKNNTSQEHWRVCFGVAVWRLWFWKNNFLFNHGSWESGFIATDIKARTKEILRCIHQPLHGKQPRVETMIRWKAPIWPCVSLNTDGAMKRFGYAGAGGLLRDYNGNWLMGFTVNLGMCSVLSAELWGLLHGLKVAWDYGFRHLQVGVDNKNVMLLLERAHPPANENAILVKTIRELLARDWIVHMEHVYREANSAADFLASYSLTKPLGLHVLPSPPPDIIGLLCNDAYGIAHSRLVLH